MGHLLISCCHVSVGREKLHNPADGWGPLQNRWECQHLSCRIFSHRPQTSCYALYTVHIYANCALWEFLVLRVRGGFKKTFDLCKGTCLKSMDVFYWYCLFNLTIIEALKFDLLSVTFSYFKPKIFQIRWMELFLEVTFALKDRFE